MQSRGTWRRLTIRAMFPVKGLIRFSVPHGLLEQTIRTRLKDSLRSTKGMVTLFQPRRITLLLRPNLQNYTLYVVLWIRSFGIVASCMVFMQDRECNAGGGVCPCGNCIIPHAGIDPVHPTQFIHASWKANSALRWERTRILLSIHNNRWYLTTLGALV